MAQRGGKRPGAGRPTGTTGAYKPEKEQKKNRSIKFSDAEWAIVQEKAKSAGYDSISEYIRAKALE
ncbi:MAG TPA: hypothetical protein GXX46_01980 [Peptococcaceae bacterium]|nr:hypothetical protein [Peptococcaceae bacterium]